MVDLSQFGTVAGLAVLIGLLMQVCLSWPGGMCIPWSWVPFYTIGFGVVTSLVIGWSLGELHEPKDVVAWVIGGLLASCTAIGSYETSHRLRRKKKKEKEEVDQ